MEEEVDLRDYVNVLLKWKWLIIWITIISMVVAGIYSYFISKPVYEGTVLLQTPVVNNNSVTNINDLESIMRSEYFSNIVARRIGCSSQEINEGISVSNLGRDSDAIKVTFDGPSTNIISKFFEVLLPTFNDISNNSYNDMTTLLKSNLSDLKNEFLELKKEKDTINLKMLELTQLKNSTSGNLLEISLLSNAYSTIVEQASEVKQQIADLEMQLQLSHGFQYLVAPTFSTHPVKPKKMFNIAVAGVAAFFFAILLAFFIEYMQGSENEDKRKGKLA